MRPALQAVALTSMLVIGGMIATSGPALAGDGFARYQQQQARLREQARVREQPRIREQARAKNASSLPKSTGARPTTGYVSTPSRPGPSSSRPSR
jgi:hypothetical protein